MHLLREKLPALATVAYGVTTMIGLYVCDNYTKRKEEDKMTAQGFEKLFAGRHCVTAPGFALWCEDRYKWVKKEELSESREKNKPST